MKKKEPPFCYPYSVKAKVLVLCHLARMDLSQELEEGRARNDDLVENMEVFSANLLLKSRPTVCHLCLLQIRGLC